LEPTYYAYRWIRHLQARVWDELGLALLVKNRSGP
jgi:hypothetical protein